MERSTQSVNFTDHVLLNPPVEAFRNTTVLSRAIKAGPIKEVRVLLEKGCDPNQSHGAWGVRPLMIAQYSTCKRRQQIVQLLLQFGAIPSLADNQGRNCLMYACALRAPESISMMLQATEYNFYDTDCYGNTLLHVCAMVGDPDIMKMVLKYAFSYRCDINSRNALSFTALMVAILRQRRESTLLLHENGATPRFTTHDFQSILTAMRERPNITESVSDGLLLRIISDSESVTEQVYNKCFDQHRKPLPSESECLQSLKEKQAMAPALGDSGLCVDHQTAKVDQRLHTLKTEVVNQSLPAKSISLQSEQQSPSYMAYIEDLLARSYHARRSASYCSPQVDKHHVDEEWVDTIRKYHHDEQCKCDTVPTEATAKISSRSPHTIRSTSGGEILPISPTLHQSSSSRSGRLSRSTTSPHIFSQYSDSRKPATYSPDKYYSTDNV